MVVRIILFIFLSVTAYHSFARDSTQTSQDTSKFSKAKFIEIIGNNLLVYDTPAIEDDKTLAVNVMQGHYLHAQGQSHYTVNGQEEEVNYLGTFGLGPCIGLGLITQVEGERNPYITVAHLDDLTLDDSTKRLDDAVEKLLEEHHQGANASQTRAVLIQGKAPDKSLKRLFTLYQCLQHRNIPAHLDPGVIPYKDLIINLKTGEVVHPSHFRRHDFSWLSVKRSTMIINILKRCFSAKRFLVQEQFDLINNNVPSNYVYAHWYRSR